MIPKLSLNLLDGEIITNMQTSQDQRRMFAFTNKQRVFEMIPYRNGTFDAVEIDMSTPSTNPFYKGDFGG